MKTYEIEISSTTYRTPIEKIEQLISDLHYHGWEGSRRMDVFRAIFLEAAKELLQEGEEFQINKQYLISLINHENN
jgi:hypothetical protein